MIVLIIIAAVLLQAGAIWTGAQALWTDHARTRNRYAFGCLVLSVAALLTAGAA